MPDQQMTDVQDLIADLITNLNAAQSQLPGSTPDQIVEQIDQLEQQVLRTAKAIAQQPIRPTELRDLHTQFTRFAEQLARAQANNERAMNALGFSQPVYAAEPAFRPRQFSVSSMSRTSVSA